MAIDVSIDSVTTLGASGVVQLLAQQIRKLEDARRPRPAKVLPTGLPGLDQRLPGGGFRSGGLVEWLAPGPGHGAAGLAWRAALSACTEQQTLVLIERGRHWYLPAIAALGVSCTRLLVVRPATVAEEHWTWEQALRCSGVGAVVGAPDRLDHRTFRRWQLAAEQGGGLGCILRGAAARHEAALAEVRLWVEAMAGSRRPSIGSVGSISPSRSPTWDSVGSVSKPRSPTGESVGNLNKTLSPTWERVAEYTRPGEGAVAGQVGLRSEGMLPGARPASARRLRLTILRSRGLAPGDVLEWEEAHATHTLHLVSPVAPATLAGRTSGVVRAAGGGA